MSVTKAIAERVTGRSDTPQDAPVALFRKEKKQRGNSARTGTNFFFLLPSLAGVGFFVLAPFVDVIHRSFTTAMGGVPVGLRNYGTVLSNQAFRLALSNTGKFLAVCIPLLLVLSLLLALVLHAIGEAAGIWRTCFLLPMAVPVASIVLLWQALFHKAGLLNTWIAALGGQSVDWMGSGKAFGVLVFSFLWKNMGYNVILWLAGLACINESMYEAARVDGAGAWRIFWRITLPNLSPCLYTILVLSLISAFKVFREAYLVAGDYPHESIYLLQHLFGNWFRELSVEKLCAAAVLVALGSLGLISLLRAVWERE